MLGLVFPVDSVLAGAKLVAIRFLVLLAGTVTGQLDAPAARRRDRSP